jgi:hypothetical protein
MQTATKSFAYRFTFFEFHLYLILRQGVATKNYFLGFELKFESKQNLNKIREIF